MRKLSVLCAALVILSAAAAVQAYQLNPSGLNVSTTAVDTSSFPGYTGYVVNVSVSPSGQFAGDLIQAVDFASPTAGTNPFGFYGTLSQWWAVNQFTHAQTPSPANTYANGPGSPDSFVINNADAAAISSSLAEDMPNTTGIVGNDSKDAFGFGTYVKGAWAYTDSPELSDQNVAYLVVPNGTQIHYDGEIALSNSNAYEVSNMTPEPASMVLVIVGAVTMLGGYVVRRRRG